MSSGQVFRIIIEGEGLDLFGSFAGASMSDWKALIADTGRGAQAVAAGVESLEKAMGTGVASLSGQDELALIETITDLVFLAKRVNKRQSGSDRPYQRYDDVADNLAYFTVLQEFGEAVKRKAAAEAATVETDPTQGSATTVSGPVVRNELAEPTLTS